MKMVSLDLVSIQTHDVSQPLEPDEVLQLTFDSHSLVRHKMFSFLILSLSDYPNDDTEELHLECFKLPQVLLGDVSALYNSTDITKV